MSKSPATLPVDNSFDTVFADKLAQLESYNKHHYRPNSYLHKWWGRRCGTTFRLILKGLVTVADESSFYQPGGLEGKIICDPMAGGGTTLHEALRLGASIVGADVDPIPIVQARASLAELSLVDLDEHFTRFYEKTAAEIKGLFNTSCPECGEATPMRFALYGLRRRCQCSEVIVVDSLLLRRDSDGSICELCAHCTQLKVGSDHQCSMSGGQPRLVTKKIKNCSDCGGRYLDRVDLPYYQRYQMLAIAGKCLRHGPFFKSPDLMDREAWQRAEDLRTSFPVDKAQFLVENGEKSAQLVRRGVINYLDLFTSRQLLYLASAMAALPDSPASIRTNLALLVSTSLEFNSLLCGYKGADPRRAGAVRHAFSHHAYSFPYTALENNPIYPRRSSGTIQKLYYGRLRRGREWALRPRERLLNGDVAQFQEIVGERDVGLEVDDYPELAGADRRFMLHHGSATRLPLPDDSVDAVVTDPPYYDSVQYSDLAAYFRVWLRQMLPDDITWSYDAENSAVDSERNGSTGRYASLMTAIFLESRRILRPFQGRLIFTFHHWHARAWTALTTALHQSGFVLINCYIVHAEHPMSVHINNMEALTHDAILVLAPRDYGSISSWRQVEPIITRESYEFTQACAETLGALLNQHDLTHESIAEHWRTALPRK